MIIILCRLHLKCLFELSKNRNTDVTNKFFQLKIVDYFTHEIQLEQEIAERIYKLNHFNSNKSLNSMHSNKNSIVNKLISVSDIINNGPI